nr:CD209 antigen-like protein B isoform X1 [Pogona vitticeps]XP_020669561.1 CD209 antigen-like protein B isoform X1 [Pogona vitticeps]XP_020669562.1 CD209 antigen-like protein B isoform X1 [Pogona vitticeps]
MAPKKPPKEAAAPKEKAGEPPKPPGPGDEAPKKPFLETPEGAKTVRILAAVWFVLAVIMVIMYAVLLNKDWNIRQALIMMREFAIEFDPRYEDKTDFQVVGLAQNLSSEMLEWGLKNDELQAEIDKLAKTLDQWKAYDKNLYHFSKDDVNWNEAVDECNTRESGLVFVKWGEEQAFIDDQVSQQKKPYWIGLKKNESAFNGVIWLGGFKAGTVYWDTKHGQPKKENGNCVFVHFDCISKRCWHYGKCTDKRRFVCKKEPIAKWYYA